VLRLCVIVGLIVTALVLYVVFAHPEVLTPGKLIAPEL
jgi:hypothetical protein